MVVLSQQIVADSAAHLETCKSCTHILTDIPIVDFSDAINGQSLIVQACKEFGFFKVVNHGISMELVEMLESEAVAFFSRPQQEKDKLGPPSPNGYGNRIIGPNGDTGWIEYILFSARPHLMLSQPPFPYISQTFWFLMGEYVSRMRNMMSRVLDMISDELRMEGRDILSGIAGDDKSDSCFRMNHYPPFPNLDPLSGRNLIGFGEHTDPQIMSVMRSSNTPGLQISLNNDAWLSVPPDPTAFYFNVGDILQVMTNGRFKSVKHRVVANSIKSRVSMVYFAGPALSQKITPLCSLMEEGEESLYEEFTWSEYKQSAYKTKLGDTRLKLFEKSK